MWLKEAGTTRLNHFCVVFCIQEVRMRLETGGSALMGSSIIGDLISLAFTIDSPFLGNEPCFWNPVSVSSLNLSCQSLWRATFYFK